MSCRRRSSPAISNEGALHGAEVTGFSDVAEADDIYRTQVEAEGRREDCERLDADEHGADRSHVLLQLRIDGVFRKMLMPSEVETARSTGAATEKANEVPLIRTVIREPV